MESETAIINIFESVVMFPGLNVTVDIESVDVLEAFLGLRVGDELLLLFIGSELRSAELIVAHVVILEYLLFFFFLRLVH